MSMLAKGLTIGALVSASLAVPIVATVSYFQNKPDSTPLLPIQDPVPPPPQPLAATILELEPLIIEATPARKPMSRAGAKLNESPPRDPKHFELQIPRIERSPVLRSRDSSSPSIASNGMPPPLHRSKQRTLVYEEHFR